MNLRTWFGNSSSQNKKTPIKRKRLTRSTGAESGGSTYLISFAIVLVAAFSWSSYSSRDAAGNSALTFLQALGYLYLASISIQIFVGHLAQGTFVCNFRMFYWSCLSQRPCPVVMRNGIIGFCECVRPGGKPTPVHCLDMYNYNGYLTSSIFTIGWLFIWTLAPLTAFLRIWWPEHWGGVKKNGFRLWLFLIKYPMAIQGEGLSNGDGLAGINGFESLMYPLLGSIDLKQGRKDRAYWMEEDAEVCEKISHSNASELISKVHLRDFFHDKVFAHRFFESQGALHPHLVCEVSMDQMVQRFDNGTSKRSTTDRLVRDDKLIWKPRYSTMGLGVEKCNYLGDQAMASEKNLAPGPEPYLIEEKIISSEYLAASEWYRMSTMWSLEWEEPRPGYCWRTRNTPGDPRVQTNIIGGAHCVTGFDPWVGPNKTPHSVYDPRTEKMEKIHPGVEKALERAIQLQLKMHKVLGQGLWSVGWDVMVRKKQDAITGINIEPSAADSHDNWEPIFIEFNVNNGFFLCDHTLGEIEQMAGFYANEITLRKNSNSGGVWS